jgi:hypothetical protein
MVWDEQTSEPAMIGGKALIGLKHSGQRLFVTSCSG